LGADGSCVGEVLGEADQAECVGDEEPEGGQERDECGWTVGEAFDGVGDARCDLPVPGLPTSRTFSRWSMYSQRVSSTTSRLLTDGLAAKSNPSSVLVVGKRTLESIPIERPEPTPERPQGQSLAATLPPNPSRSRSRDSGHNRPPLRLLICLAN
jgi:hypothetical protein